MRWILCLVPALLLLTLSSPARAQLEPEEDWVYAGRVSMLVFDGRHSDALDLAASFMAKHPDSPAADSIFRNVVKCRWNEPELLPKVDEVLRAAMNGYPFRRCGSEAKDAVEATRHWSFSECKRRRVHLYRPGEKVSFSFGRRGGTTSTFRILRVPAPMHQQVLGELPTDEFHTLDTALYAHRAKWESVDERLIGFPHGSSGTYYRLQLEKPGRYYVEEEIEGFRRLEPLDLATYALIVWCVGDSALIATLDSWTGEPVPGVNVTVRMKDRTEKGVTDGSGLFRVEGAAEGIVLARKGDEVHGGRLELWSRDERKVLYHVSLDRPLYRPGDTVHYKVVRRDRSGGQLALPADPQITVTIQGPDKVEVHRATLTWSRMGTISGTAKLPEDASPAGWGWGLAVFPGESWKEKSNWWDGVWQDFRVAEFELPEARITVEADSRARVLGSPVRVLVRGEHWWGAPAEGIEVEWEVNAYRAGNPEMDGELSGRWQGRPWPDPYEWFYEGDPDSEFRTDVEDFGLEGRGETGPDGVLAIEFDTEPDAEPIRYQVSVRAVGASGREIRFWEDVLVQPAEVIVRAGTTRMFCEPGKMFEGGVAVTDLDGNPVADREVQLTLLQGVTYGRTIEFHEYDSMRLRTGGQGDAWFGVRAPPSGRLRLRATVLDDAGRRAIHRSDRWVASPETNRHVEDDEDSMMLPDRAVYAAGETARILVDTETHEGPLLFVVAGEVIHEARFIRLEGRFQVIEVPVKPEYAPGVYVKLFAVRGGGYEEETVTVAGCELLVLPPGGWVDVRILTDRDVYGPRSTVKIELETSMGLEPIPAEVELAVVDESVFTLEPDETEDIRHFFWESWEDEDWWWGPGPLGYANTDGWFHWINTARNQGRGYGFGMGAPPAKEGFAPAEVRSRGPDTILWSGTVETDEHGQAEVEFVTSGRLTTWRVMARAVAGVDRFGQATAKLVTEQDVVVRLGAPPSMTERDEGTVAVSMRNDLDEAEEFLIQLEVEGAGEGGGGERVTVAAGAEARVDFPLRATGPGTIRLIAGALSVSGSDKYETTIPVRAHGTVTVESDTARLDPVWETTLTLPDNAVPGTGLLRVTADTIPRVIQHALSTIADWQVPDFAGDVATRLSAVVHAREALQRAGMKAGVPTDRLDSLIREDLYRLGALQRADGGFGRRGDPASDPSITDLVVRAMSLARGAGHPVPRRVLEDALRRFEAAGGGVEPMKAIDPDVYLARRQGACWPTPVETARAVVALARHSKGRHPPVVTATVNGEAVELSEGAVEIPGGKLSAGPIRIRLEKKAGGRIYGSAKLVYEDPDAEGLTAESEGIHVERRIERKVTLDNGKEAWRLLPDGAGVKVGDRLRISLLMRAEVDTGEAIVTCPLPGGVVTRSSGTVEGNAGRWLDRSEFHLDRVDLHLHHVPTTTARYVFEIRPVLPGTWHVMPAEAAAAASPEVNGRSAEVVLRVE